MLPGEKLLLVVSDDADPSTALDVEDLVLTFVDV